MGTYSGAAGYLWVVFASIIFAIGASVFGDHDLTNIHDVSHGGSSDADDGPGVLSIRNISMFFMGFGVAGALAQMYTGSQTIAVISGCVTGLIFSILVFFISRFFYRQQATTESSTGSLVGKSAQVVLEVRPGCLGEISVVDRYGTPQTFPAISADGSIYRAGVSVRIISFAGVTASVQAVEA